MLEELTGGFALISSIMAVVTIRTGLYRRTLPPPKNKD